MTLKDPRESNAVGKWERHRVWPVRPTGDGAAELDAVAEIDAEAGAEIGNEALISEEAGTPAMRR